MDQNNVRTETPKAVTLFMNFAQITFLMFVNKSRWYCRR